MVGMVRIYEKTKEDLALVREYSELDKCGDGLREYLKEKGYTNEQVEELIGNAYYETGYRHFILDLHGTRIISEEE